MICCFTLGAGITVIVIFGWVFLRKRTSIDLKDKVVMIVGASSGIGEACAQIFYEAGCKLILCARRTEELERVKKELTQLHMNIPGHVPEVKYLDASNFDTIDTNVQSCSGVYGKVDVLISSSGISYRGKVLETSLSVDQSLMNVNYFGHVAIVKGLLRDMVDRRSGHIVFISSLQGKLSIPYRSAYAASKHALQGFADCLRSEVSQYNVNVTVVSPAYVKTKLSLNALKSDGTLHGIMDDNQKSGMEPMEVAKSVLEAVTAQQNEVLLSKLSYRLAVYFRNIFPDVYFYFISKKATV